MFINHFVRPAITSGFILIIAIPSGCQTSNNSKSQAAETLIQQAAASFGAGDYRKNADLLKQAADTDPDNPRVWWKLCEAYQLTEELDLAVKACKQELNLHPSSSSHNGLGLVYLAKKKYPQASAEFEKATADSNISAIHRNYVWALLESKQYQRAIPAAQRLVDVSRTDPPELKSTQSAYQYLAMAYMGAGQVDTAQKAVRTGFGTQCSMQKGDKQDWVVQCHGSSVKDSVGPPTH